MPDATYAVPGFLGGEISDVAQGRFDKPEYRISMNICLNGFPGEIGVWMRRPGSAYGSHTRGGAAGRVIKFDFEQANAVTLELTDGFMRFRSGTTLLTTNDDQTVTSISAANPGVVSTAAPHGWASNDTVMWDDDSPALLQNRQFLITVTGGQTFTMVDALTGAAIDGATLGTFVSGSVRRVQELAIVYVSGAWDTVRSIQAETTAVLLCPLYAPQALTVSTLPSTNVEPQFDIEQAVFNDGPYLDPLLNGVMVTPSAVSGLIDLTLSFPSYSATTAYAQGSFVTSVGVDYVSLVDQNVGNTPAISPASWQATTAAAAINDGRGFLGSDIGRLIRLLSEPPVFNIATAYASFGVVTYNPSGVPGASTYWSAKTGTTGNVPGADLEHWELIASGASTWTWGRITGLSNIIDRSLAGSVAIGDMTLFNGITAPFDGQFVKVISQTAGKQATGGAVPPDVPITIQGYVGKNFSGASAQKIKQATIYSSTDRGFGFNSFVIFGVAQALEANFVVNLRAKQTVPGSSSDGTVLGTSPFSHAAQNITIISNDQTTAWNYVWVEVVMTVTPGGFGASSYTMLIDIAQISLFNPTTSTSASAGCTVEVLGPALLYTNPIVTWRLGVYSDTTGWPTCGTYHEGRIWLGGAVPNRFDACVSDGVDGIRINFAPTNQFGVVAASNALSYTLNSDGVNPLFWMKPDLLGVVIGTQQGEWLVQAPTNGPIAPTNIAVRRMTKNGSENIDPVRAPNANLFVKRHSQKLMEYFADAYSGKFSAPNLADKAGHIVRAGIAELAYTDGLTPIVWGRDANDALFGMTYRRTVISAQQGPDFYAWHRHTLGSGRTVESICGGPSVDGDLDALTMVTNDSSGTRHVEVLTDGVDEDTDVADTWMLDNSVVPTSQFVDMTPIVGAPFGGVYLYGLWHLNDKTVQVFAGGLDCGERGTGTTGYTDFAVANGFCFVPFGDGVSGGCGRGGFTPDFLETSPQIVVGFTYNSDGQIVRPISPADTGARNGPALGKTRRNHQYSALVTNTLGVSFGATFTTLRPAQFRKNNGNPLDALTAYSGVHHDSLDDDYSYDGMIAWRISRPWPAHIIAISGNIQSQDR